MFLSLFLMVLFCLCFCFLLFCCCCFPGDGTDRDGSVVIFVPVMPCWRCTYGSCTNDYWPIRTIPKPHYRLTKNSLPFFGTIPPHASGKPESRKWPSIKCWCRCNSTHSYTWRITITFIRNFWINQKNDWSNYENSWHITYLYAIQNTNKAPIIWIGSHGISIWIIATSCSYGPMHIIEKHASNGSIVPILPTFGMNTVEYYPTYPSIPKISYPNRGCEISLDAAMNIIGIPSRENRDGSVPPWGDPEKEERSALPFIHFNTNWRSFCVCTI